MIPKVIVSPKFDSQKIIFNLPKCDVEVSFDPEISQEYFSLIKALDGTRTITELSSQFVSLSKKNLHEFIDELYSHNIVDDCSLPEGRLGIDVLFEIEDLTNELLYKTLYKNPFWLACQNAKTKGDIPLNVIYGQVIENYHFLFRESYFDAPVLSYVGNLNVRLALNAFFAEEYGHDELLLQSLNSVGITRSQLSMTMPLPETMGLCNALAYWSHNDPLFFFTTLGVLEGKDIKQDSFIEAAIRMGFPSKFIDPVQTHSNINLKGEHGNLTREIFSAIPIIDIETIKRLRSQTYLFVELYDALYTGIWNYYSNPDNKLLRLVNEI
ncbi:MAG: hypothetical protein HKM04_08215 [Legionellales bacterium]|nr:hypothetical protein [Legionellales bacterium]